MLAEKVVGRKECAEKGNRPIEVTFGIGDINAQSSRLLFWSIGKIAEESFWDFQFLEISKFRKCRSEAIIRAAVSQSQFFSQDARESLEHEQGRRNAQVPSIVPVNFGNPPALIRAIIHTPIQ
jgi:hypothetical protein